MRRWNVAAVTARVAFGTVAGSGTISRTAKPPKYALVKRLALALPDAHEVLTLHGFWFNVGTKTFALYSVKDARWIFKLPHDRQEFLFEVRPETFAPMRAGLLRWAFVRVEDLDATELKELLTTAWSTIAKRAQVKALKGG